MDNLEEEGARFTLWKVGTDNYTSNEVKASCKRSDKELRNTNQSFT